jgi:hypothetical protein
MTALPAAVRAVLQLFAVSTVCLLISYAPLALAAVTDTRSLKAEALFRLANPCPATGLSNGPCKGYVIDRIIPVICGGIEEPANMQWQTIAEAREKDRWERIGCRPGRVLYRPERPVIIEAFPLSDGAAPVEAAPLEPQGQPQREVSQPDEATDAPTRPEVTQQQ